MWIFPTMTQKPPTLYSILNSIVNYDKEDKTKIPNLAEAGHSEIFDFDYPLSEHVNKDEFEINILNHYIMRRIGFDTPTAFKLALRTKLNEIMPYYNKMFDALDGWNLFNSGESISRNLTDTTSTNLNEQASDYSVNDLRSSNMPEGKLSDIRDASYISDYNYNQNNANRNSVTSGDTDKSVTETISKTPADKINILKEFKENINSIYTDIYKDLDLLFYGLL